MKGRRAREDELLERALRAISEGKERAQIDRALGTLGADFPTKPQNTDFCVNAVTAFIEALARSADLKLSSLDDDEAYVLGLFLMVTSNHLCRIVGAQFEIAAAAAHIAAFGPERANSFSSLIDSYNAMSTRGDTITAIGNTIARWFADPTNENFARLSKLLSICLDGSRTDSSSCAPKEN